MSVQFTDNSAAVKAQFEKNKAKALEMIGLHADRRIVEEITKMGVVDTGRLRSAQAHQVDAANDQVIVGNPVSYAVYQHEGTRRIVGRPFIRNGVLNYMSEYKQIAEQTLGEGFDK